VKKCGGARGRSKTALVSTSAVWGEAELEGQLASSRLYRFACGGAGQLQMTVEAVLPELADAVVHVVAVLGRGSGSGVPTSVMGIRAG